MSKKILVSGGAGFIGSHTVVELIGAGFEPIIVDNFCNSQKDVVGRIEQIVGEKLALYEGDCTDEAFVRNIFKSEGLSGAIHFAAFKAVGESINEPIKYYENNINSLLVLLKVMLDSSARNLVFSSSATVYGQPDELPVTEASPRVQAESAYGNTKIVCEQILEDVVKAKKGINVLSLRYFNPVGAHPSGLIGELPIGVPNNLVPFVTQLAAGIREKLTVFGDDYNTPDGTCIRDYIHIVDLAKAHVQALKFLAGKKDVCFYDMVNIGTGMGSSVMEVLKIFEEVSGVKLNYVIGERREGDVESVYADVKKGEMLLDWKAQLSLKQALADSWNWQQNLAKIKEGGF